MTKPNTYSKLSIDTQKEIKAKYMEGYNTSQLADEYNLTRQALGWHVRSKNWKDERALLRAELFAAFSDTKKAAFTGIYMDGTTLLHQAIKDAIAEYKDDKSKMTVSDKLDLAKSISSVIKELDKIQRLDEGSPTEIKEDRPFSVKEVQAKLVKDPFYLKEPADADFKEITD